MEFLDDPLDAPAVQPVASKGFHLREPDEYRPGPRRIELVSMDEARYAHLDEHLSLDDIDAFVTGVRGAQYHADLTDPARGEAWFELVPEPGNPWDPFAIAVDLNGRRLGYVSSRMAMFFNWMIASLNTWSRCFVPGLFLGGGDAVMAMPTLARIQREQSLLSAGRLRLQALFLEDGNNALRSAAVAAQQEMTPELVELVWQHRDVEPDAFPPVPVAEMFPPLWSIVLRDIREDLWAWRSDQARSKRLQQQARAEQLSKAREERREAVLAAYQSGLSTAAISRSMAVSASTVKKDLAAMGAIERSMRDPATTVSEHASRAQTDRLKRCERAVELFESGMTRHQVANALDTSLDAVKILLADGRFFRDPTSNPGRLAKAVAIDVASLTNAVAAKGGLLGALRDARVLAKLGRLPSR